MARTSRRAPAYLLGAAFVLLASGCAREAVSVALPAATPAAAQPAAKPTTPPSFAPPPQGGQRYSSVGIVTFAPPPDAKPGITSADALAAFWAGDFGRSYASLATGRPAIVLRVAQDGSFGLPNDVSTYRNRLVWVMTFGGSPPDLRGPSVVTAAAGLSCSFVYLADAQTGQAVDAFQTCS